MDIVMIFLIICYTLLVYIFAYNNGYESGLKVAKEIKEIFDHFELINDESEDE